MGANLLTERGQQTPEILANVRKREAQPIRLHRVLDVHRGRTEMQLSAAALCLLGEDANLGHQIVMNRALDLERGLDVDVGGMRAQDLRVRPLQ